MLKYYPIRLRLIIPLIVSFFFVLASVVLVLKQFSEEREAALASVKTAVSIQMYKLQNSLADLLALEKAGLVERQISEVFLDPNIKIFVFANEYGIVNYANVREFIGSPINFIDDYDEKVSKICMAERHGGRLILGDNNCFFGYYPVLIGLQKGEVRKERIGRIFFIYDFSVLIAKTRDQAIQNGLLYCFSGFCFAALLSYILYLVITSRLNRINRAMHDVAQGSLSLRLRFNGKDEIATLASGFDRMAESLEKERDMLLLMQFVVDHSADSIFLVQADSSLFYVNDAACRLLGYSKDELLQMSLCGVDVRYASNVWGEHWSCLKESRTLTYESLLFSKSGQEIDVEICANYFCFGGREYDCSFMRDIRLRKQAEASLKCQNEEIASLNEEYRIQNDELHNAKDYLEKSESRLREAQHIAKMGDWEFDLLTDYFYWSDELYRIFEVKYPSGRIALSTVCSFIHPEELESVKSAYSMHLHSKQEMDLIVRVQTGSGQIKSVNVRCRTEYRADGKPVLSVGTLVDVTDRIRNEEELRTSRERFELAINGSHSGIWDWDLRTNQTFFSKRWKDQIGYLDEELPNNFDTWEAHLHPDDKALVLENLKWYLEGKTSEYSVEFRFLHKNGSFVWIHARGEVFRDNEGRPCRMAGSHTEITDRKRAEDELAKYREHLEDLVRERTVELERSRFAALSLMQDANKEKLRMQGASFVLKKNQTQLERAKLEAEKANNAKSEFLSNMSHELRTPLNAILGFSKILKQQKNMTENQKEQLETISNCGEHLLSLINDILDMSKIEAQKLELVLCEFSLQQAVRTVFNISKVKADEKELEFVLENVSDLPEYVLGDERKLKQVMLNLANNAVKFTDSGRIVISVGYKPEVSVFVFEVADTGIGIPEERQMEVFYPFVQYAGDKLFHEGTGLGLSISKELVGLMRGEIHLHSVPGEGSTFRIEIPMQRVFDSSLEPDEREVEICGYLGRRRKVLIVDDHPANLALFEGLLEPLGFLLAVAEDGKHALEVVEKFKPDLVLLDYRIPMVDGGELGAALRRIPAYSEIKLLGVSASVQPKDSLLAFKDLCHDFILKPVGISQLLSKLEVLLGLEWIEAEHGCVASCTNKKHLLWPPDEAIEEIRQDCELGDYASMLELLGHIVEKDDAFLPFRNIIYKYLRNYDFEGILSYLMAERTMGEDAVN